MSFKVQAFKVMQREVALFVTVFTAGELLSCARVDYWRQDNKDGYQRPLKERRLREVATYVCQNLGLLPTSVLLAVRGKRLGFEPESGDVGEGGEVSWGRLSVDDGTVFWVVDGQHRLYGLNRAIESGAGPWANQYPVPATIVDGVDRYTEMSIFNIVNTKQKPVPTDIVDQHLSRMVERQGADLISQRGIVDYKRGRTASIVRLLNQSPGPWYRRVKIHDVPGMERGLIRYHSLVASLVPVLNDAWLNAMSDANIAYLLSNYWIALRNLMPEAFRNPGEYRIQTTTGVYALHILFPLVVGLCAAVGDYSTATMERVLRYTDMTPQFWLRVHGDELAQASDMGSIRRLAASLRGKLPNARQIE